MAQTPPPTIDPAPTPAPQRGDRATFSGRVDAFVTWLTAAVAQFAALASNVYANGQDVYTQGTAITTSASNSAAAAATSASNAASSAAAAASTANTSVWVSGATIAQFANVISPADARTYRRKTATGSGTTDPSADPTNYVLVSAGLFPSLKVSQRAASGTPGGTSTTATWNIRSWTTTDRNTIAGASVSGANVTLPAGTYRLERCRSLVNGSGANQVALYSTTDNANLVVGSSANTPTGSSAVGESSADGEFTISATKTVQMRHYTATGVSNNGLGAAASTGAGELYAEMTLVKVA